MKSDYKMVKVELRQGVAILTLDNPPVNQLSKPFSEEYRAVVKAAIEDKEIKAVVVTGTGKNFIAGADLKELQQVTDRDSILLRITEVGRFLNFMEGGAKPVIFAINGNCLGGGMEHALACHYRIAAEGIKVGQPEVQVGLIPGTGGTQRLPRLVGLQNALQMIVTGQAISAEEGMKKGCIDQVVPLETLLDQALAAAHRFISGEWDHRNRVTRLRKDRLPDALAKQTIIASAKEEARKKNRGYIAPFKAIEAMERGLTEDFEADLKMEAQLAADCTVSDVAKNLIGIFVNTRAVGNLPRINGVEPQRPRTVGMLGGGVMGSGIANLLLSYGFDTLLWDIHDEAIQRDLSALRKTFDFSIKKGSLTQGELDRTFRERLKTTTSLQDLSRVDMIIEAVVEDMGVKQGIWKQLQEICRPEAVFASNTSALSITEMASVLRDPGRLIGMHFFNPAERMQLLEIISGKLTSDVTLATSVAVGKTIRKVPIVVNDGPGFYVSRQLSSFLSEQTFLVDEGVDPFVIDQAVLEFGLPMGPATLSDLSGMDVTYRVRNYFEKCFGERWKMPPIWDLIYQTGCYGRKTGAGWYEYHGDKPVPNPKVQEVIRTYLKERGIRPKTLSNREIVDRMLARAINEAGFIIEEGICDRPEEMDLAMIYGTGFPQYRGGVLRHADAWGIRTVYDYLLKLEQEQGIRFKPGSLLKEMAESGRTFYRKG